MSRIIVLEENLVNKIAAGEVVERPASVVKELAENSVDAGATRITVEVQNGGKDLIRVTDNGLGMSPEELKLCLERHSTSKIKTIDDLFAITTLGFRGEALPSIASVSRMELISRPLNGQGNGFRILVEGGWTREAKEFGCPAGTAITVKNLFYNTPARRKYMKSDATEMVNILDLINKFILSYPEISFKLVSNGREIVASSGSGNLLDAIFAVYGTKMAKEMLPLNFSLAGINLTGYISAPTFSRADRNYITFFVNRRSVRNQLLTRSLENGYRNIIPSGKYPAAIINLGLDPQKVDVNVHPTKREVRFERPSEAIAALESAVKSVLAGSSAPANPFPIVTDANQEDVNTESFFFKAVIGDQLPVTDWSSSSAPHESLPFQLGETYIVTKNGDGLVIVDQHAAHERILYQNISAQKDIVSQSLLVPVTLELPASEMLLLESNLTYLKELGFDFEEFGRATIVIRAIPDFLSEKDLRVFFSDLAHELKESGKTTKTDEVIERINKFIACRAAIKANLHLSREEMERLLQDLAATPQAATCPHGRPTMVRISEAELSRRFART